MILQRQLLNQLKLFGYKIEERKYTPHITLGRQVIMNQSLNEFIFTPFEIPIKSIALMVSKRVGEQLIYEPIDEILIG